MSHVPLQRISEKTYSSLIKLNQRKLEKGEIFLLAKAIADELPLAPVDTDNINMYILSHKLSIDDVLHELNKYTYLDDSDFKVIHKLISELSLWRYNIAYNPPAILFRCGEDSVIDDISCLPRYIDIVYMCSVADIVDNANYMYNLFRSFVKETITISVNKGD